MLSPLGPLPLGKGGPAPCFVLMPLWKEHSLLLASCWEQQTVWGWGARLQGPTLPSDSFPQKL